MTTLLFALIASAPLIIGSVYTDDPSAEKTNLPIINQKVTYSEVVDCGGVSQLDLFRRARLWVIQANHSINEAFIVSDKETGELAGRLSQVITVPRSENTAARIYTFRYQYVIECANRKYRVTLTQIELDEGNGHYTSVENFCQTSEKDHQVICQGLQKQLTDVLSSLQQSMKNYKAF